MSTVSWTYVRRRGDSIARWHRVLLEGRARLACLRTQDAGTVVVARGAGGKACDDPRCQVTEADVNALLAGRPDVLAALRRRGLK